MPAIELDVDPCPPTAPGPAAPASMPAFEQEVCQHLPLADAVYRLLDCVTADLFLDEIFARHRGASYQDVITFPLFVHLIAGALLQRDGSAHQSFQRARTDGTLPASVVAMYGKLKRVPLSLSQGLLAETTQRLQTIFPAVDNPLPKSLQAFAPFGFDGKKLKFVAKRLKPLRAVRGQVLGGKLLVVQHLSTGLALAFAADADGEAADNGLVAGALAQVRARYPHRPRLWIGDRLFCDLMQMMQLSEGDDHFLLRYQAKVGFHLDPERAPRTGHDRRGLAYREDWGWLGSATHPRRRYVRRITLERPGQKPIILVTSLLDADLYPAADLSDAYLRRWGLEKMFQQVTEVFDLRHLIGSTPQATVFQAAFCFLLYNLIQAVRGYIATAQQRSPETISTPNLFLDVTRQLTAWNELVTADQTVAWLHEGIGATEPLQVYLSQRLAGLWKPEWDKAAPKPRRREPTPTQYLKGGHSSVFRILRGLHKLSPEPGKAGKKTC
jgi:Transposase DDE domain